MINFRWGANYSPKVPRQFLKNRIYGTSLGKEAKVLGMLQYYEPMLGAKMIAAGCHRLLPSTKYPEQAACIFH